MKNIEELRARIARRERAIATDPTKQYGFHRQLAEALLAVDRHQLESLEMMARVNASGGES